MMGANKIVEKVLGQSNIELVKYLDSIHARLEKLNEQTDVIIEILKTRNENCCNTKKETDSE
jgi:hypothetical protein